MLKVYNKDTRTTVNFEHISHLFLVFLILTLNNKMLRGLVFLLLTLSIFQILIKLFDAENIQEYRILSGQYITGH